MGAVLLLLTIVSLAAAAGFGLLTWRLLREDRRRAAARVAALSSALDGDDAVADSQAGAGRAQPVPVAAMFETASGASLKGRPLLKAAVGGVMAVTVIVAAAMSDGGRVEPATSATSRGPGQLELMSMRHERQGTTLTVTGLVRNPASGAEARRVIAVVFAFDRAGGFVASGRAPLDVNVLAPDDESPFVVTIPNVADVARYRVSFRTEAGVLRHVDRRADQVQLAGNH
jgi:hypothetical protein